MLLFLSLSALVAAAALPSDLARPALGVKPKWVIDYAVNSCILSRARSSQDGGLTIETRPYENDHELAFLLPPEGNHFVKPGRLSIADSRPTHVSFISVEEPRDGPDRIAKCSISDEQLLLAQRESTLGMTVPGRLDARVSVAGLAKALRALDTCEQNLAMKWGTPKNWAIDPEPLVDPNTVFRAEDYPPTMVSQGKTGFARLLFKIDPSGLVSECRAIEFSGPKTFAELVCAIVIKRVKFSPAKDTAGQSVSSYYVVPKVRFELAN